MVKEIQKPIISVPQTEANKVITNSLKTSDRKVFGELVEILKEKFKGITDTQCHGIIYRAYSKKDAVLVKEGKHYRLKTKKDEEILPVGLDKIRKIIQKAINDIDNIAAGEFATPDDFETYKKIKENLNKLI